jgi:hypothetical protein
MKDSLTLAIGIIREKASKRYGDKADSYALGVLIESLKGIIDGDSVESAVEMLINFAEEMDTED